MKTYNTYFHSSESFKSFLESSHIEDNPQLLIQVFTGLTQKEEILKIRDTLYQMLPQSTLIGATTDGEICSGEISTGQTVIALTQFEQTTLKSILVTQCHTATQAGKDVANAILTPETKLIITFTDGLQCHAEDYLKAIYHINPHVIVAGGLAGDNAQFQTTYVFTHHQISSHGAVGVSLNSKQLYISTDYSFNWLAIGKEMVITKVEKNRVYTINHTPAYNIYKHYLGEEIANNLPALGAEFPLIIQKPYASIARAILERHHDGSLSFGGDFQVGDLVNFGYGDAQMILNQSIETQYTMKNKPLESIFIYSCMARRRFMPDLIECEIAPFQALANVTGFFTYGEFFSYPQSNVLLNQSMTLVGLSESAQATQEKDIESPSSLELNAYQTSIKALSRLLNITTKELSQENQQLVDEKKVLSAREASLQQAQEVGHFGSWEIDLRTNEATWSQESYRIYQLDPETTHPTLDTFISRVIPADQYKLEETLLSAYDGEVKTLEVRVKREDGNIITLLLNGKMLFNEKKQAIKLIGTTLDITEQIKLREQNKALATIIENSNSEIYIVDRLTYTYMYVNNEAVEKLHYTKEEFFTLSFLDVNQKMTFEYLKDLEKKHHNDDPLFLRTIHTKKDGSTYPVHSYIQFRKLNHKDVMIVFDIDVTDLVAAERKQKHQADILEQIHDAVIATDVHGFITDWNHGASIMLGYNEKEMVGKPIYLLFKDSDLSTLKNIQTEVIKNNTLHTQIELISKESHLIYTDLSCSILKDEYQNPIGITHYAQDITQKKKIEEQLQQQTELLNFQAYHDNLTQLPNRALFEDRLEQSLKNAHRNKDIFGLLFIDLDNFKHINDTLGHDIGDKVLQMTAKRLLSCIREEDTLARIGGDEFTMIIQKLHNHTSVTHVANKIIQALEPALLIEKHTLHISASIGISIYPQDATSKQDLLKYADTAMYQAKHTGRNKYVLYQGEGT